MEGLDLLLCVLESFGQLDVLMFIFLKRCLEFSFVFLHLLHSLLVPPTVILMLVIEHQLKVLVLRL
jgi:hypothetical protein